MGALHDGHATLVRTAVTTRLPVVVTVFVNPTQFNDPADFARYPRTFEADVALCERAGAECVYAPDIEDVYPSGIRPRMGDLPPVATQPGLEDRQRAGHFAGVYQVVKRLFEMTRPVIAFFGEKDWQQLQVVRALAAAEFSRLRIEGVPTVRDPDGLAMSSRNRFLSIGDRARAINISRALREALAATHPEKAEELMTRVLAGAGLEIEYAVVRHRDTLLQPLDLSECRALIAVRCGSVRLIDNGVWRPRGST